MSGWAGFWIGCGLLMIGVGLGHIGDQIEIAARLIVDSLCDNEESDDV